MIDTGTSPLVLNFERIIHEIKLESGDFISAMCRFSIRHKALDLGNNF